MSFDEPARSGSAAKIGFIAALGVECTSLRGRAPAGDAWLVVQSGPGAARAAAAAARAIDSGARVLVSWGLAGGLDAALAPGTVVAPRRVLTQQAETLAVDSAWHSSLVALADEFALDCGDLLSVGTALESPAAKRAAAAATRAVAVDMESAAIAAVAARARVPFLVLRVVVDGAGDALPGRAEQWIDERGNRRTTATLRALVSWRQWRPLVTLAKRYRVASGVLDRLAHALARRRLPAFDTPAVRVGS
jgi:adenosylhomocysteine nucleosidase